MRRGSVWIVAVPVLTAVLGCRASLEGKKVSSLASDPKSGITYYLTRPVFTIDVKDRADNKDAEPVYDLKASSDADSARRFTVRLKGGTITRDVVNLKLQPNGTLASFGVTSESQIPQLVTALGSLATAALSFTGIGLPALGAISLSQGESLDEALIAALCEGKIDPKEFSNAECAASELNLITGLQCEGRTVVCADGREIDTPPSDPATRALEQSALKKLLETTGRIIEQTEPLLWQELGRTVSEGDVRAFTTNVQQRQRKLLALRALESALADKLDAEASHDALKPPDPSQLSSDQLNQIQVNLRGLINNQLNAIRQARADDMQAASDNERRQAAQNAKDAVASLADLVAIAQAVSPELVSQIFTDRIVTLENAIQTGWTNYTQALLASDQAKADESLKAANGNSIFLADIATAAETVAPGLLDKIFNDRIARLEKIIKESFARGELATIAGAKDRERVLLPNYRVIVTLRAIRQGIPSPSTPKEQVSAALAKKKKIAEQFYAQFVGDPRFGRKFRKALADYTAALDRFLAVDDRLQGSTLRRQQQALVKLPDPTGPTGNESKAYRDYREELEHVLERINTRIGSAIDPKTPEKLQRGTQVTRTLDQIPACVIESRKQLTDNEQELLLLAEMWIKYGGQESIVFRNRSSLPEKPQDRLDCGTSPFGASVSARLGHPSTQGSTVAAMHRVASGMHVRRLTIADIESADFRPQGVLVQVPVPYDVVAVLVGPSGDRVMKAANLSLPADDEFLDLGFKGSTFRSQELSVGLHPNGSVAEYKLDSVQKVSDTVQNVAGATKGITDTLVEIKKAQPAAADPVDTENSELRLEILNLMLKENLRAIQEGRALPFPDLFKS